MVRTPACHAPCKDDANCRDNYLSSASRGPGADNRRPPASQPTVTRALSSLTVLAAAVALAALAGARPGASAGVGHDATGAQTEVVVQLSAPPLARAGGPAAVRRIAAEQRTFTTALRRSIPGARVRWRYRHVANGLAVALPRTEVSQLPGAPRRDPCLRRRRLPPDCRPGRRDDPCARPAGRHARKRGRGDQDRGHRRRRRPAPRVLRSGAATRCPQASRRVRPRSRRRR